MTEAPLVSVVITTKNEEKNIANCLQSIAAQSYPCERIEILVVDNNSTDRTKDIAREYTDKVFNKGPERSAQRNFGIRESSGKYVLYLDADMIMGSQVIATCVNECGKDEVLQALYISEIVTGDSFWSKVRRFERSFYDGTSIDCVRFMRKSTFLSVGGFDENMTGPEDWDFDKKIRQFGQVKLIKEPIYHNEAAFNLKKYLSKKDYYAKSFNTYIAKWGKDDVDIKKQFGFSYRYFGVFFEKGKWSNLLKHPILTFGMYFLRGLVGVVFLRLKTQSVPTNSVKVLLVTPFFLPNIGGAETYASELTEYLRTHNCQVNVLTYQPMTTTGVRGLALEKRENITIRRYQWIGLNLFHILEKYPLVNFLYLTPYLLIRSIFWMMRHGREVSVIDGQGFNSAVIALILKKLFRKKAVVTVLSLYDFVPRSRIAKLVKWIILRLDAVIVESEASKAELVAIGVPQEKMTVYTEWVDLEKFRPYDKVVKKKELGFVEKFTVLFVGRAIPIKGADIMIEVAKKLSVLPIQFVFISNAGPMMEILRQTAEVMPNISFIPGVPYHRLAEYESAADLAVVPSRYSENAAITVVTAISCGTPVVASNRGAIPSLMAPEVGIVAPPEVADFAQAIKKIFEDTAYYQSLQQACRPYAEAHFSINNAATIADTYRKTLGHELVSI